MRISASSHLHTGIALALISTAGAQNLVPNGGFEEYENCPDNAGQIELSTGWVSRQGSPEYFHQCSSDEWASVPHNKVGYQIPHDGLAYAGIITYSDSNWFWAPELLREHIARPLSEPLLPNVPVYVSVWISPAAFGMPGGRVRWTVDGVGVKFVMSPPSLPVAVPAENDAELTLSFAPTDTASWIQLSGVVIPDSAYDCIVIGNFRSDSLLSTVEIDPEGNYGVGYIYVDDVCVSYSPFTCPIAVGQEEFDQSVVLISPNPTSGLLEITVPIGSRPSEILGLFNSLGQKVISGQGARSSTRTTLDIRAFPPGIYWLLVQLGGMSRAYQIVHHP